jgi:LPXTG-site transpeptidase (sortase) family protein
VKRFVTVKRFQNVRRIQTIKRLLTITNVHTVTKILIRHRTVITFRTVVRQQVRVLTRIVVHQKTFTKTIIRTRLVTIVRHRTIISIVHAVRVIRHPGTGRFALLRTAVARAAAPTPDAFISVPRLGISFAPVWSRSYVDDGHGGFTYDIVPLYGVTRFAYSAPFGKPGTTLAYGHDDIYGSIFRYLSRVQLGDAITIVQGQHRYRYSVTSLSIVNPDDVSMLNAARTQPTLALVSCTPYWVDTQRVVVLAELKR